MTTIRIAFMNATPKGAEPAATIAKNSDPEAASKPVARPSMSPAAMERWSIRASLFEKYGVADWV
jgi:hypothetical protein